MRELVLELGMALRRHVLPSLGSHAGRSTVRAGAGGDVTFAIDEEAETFLEQFLAERAPGVAFYSEDRGLVRNIGRRSRHKPDDPLADKSSRHKPDDPLADRPQVVLIVDPIDGTRPAMAGLESCCVSVAAAELGAGEPTMGDVRAGCVVEIKSGAIFVAERGGGVELIDPAGGVTTPSLSANADTTKLFWSAGFRGRPAAPLVHVLEELIDASSVGGGFFDLGSATFDMTRILTGQLDAYVDVGSRMIDEAPDLRQRFEEVGGGAVLNNSPYDLAASVLCLEEGGAIVTDAYGEPLDRRPLLGSGHDFQMSCLSAANVSLHSELVSAIGRGIRRLLA